MTKTIKKTVSPKYNNEVFDVQVTPKQSIRMTGTYQNRTTPIDFDNTFKVGDKAEYDSWNLSYIGTIVSITANSVIIDQDMGDSSPKKRLPLGEFCNRNWDFDLDTKIKENAEESMYL